MQVAAGAPCSRKTRWPHRLVQDSGTIALPTDEDEVSEISFTLPTDEDEDSLRAPSRYRVADGRTSTMVKSTKVNSEQDMAAYGEFADDGNDEENEEDVCYYCDDEDG